MRRQRVGAAARVPERGFPVRGVSRGLYGYVSACRWIGDMELTTFTRFEPHRDLRSVTVRAGT